MPVFAFHTDWKQKNMYEEQRQLWNHQGRSLLQLWVSDLLLIDTTEQYE